MAALRQLSALRVRVRRDGAETVVAARDLVPGDLLVLCSDGIWEHIRENEYWDAACHPDLDSAAHLLAEQAGQRGGTEADNATLVLLRAAKPDKPAATTPWWRQLGATCAALLGRGRR